MGSWLRTCGCSTAGEQQQDDGGWPVESASYSPAAALEWRGHMSVRALSILRRNYVF